MKKIKILLTAVLFAVTLSLVTPHNADASGNISIYIDGVKQSYSNKVVVENGNTLVPLRGIFEELGATVSWDQKTQTIDARKGDITVQLKLGSKQTKVNGITKTIAVPAKAINGSTLVPLRFISEALGATVEWNQQTRSINIVKGSVVGKTRQTAAKINETVLINVDDLLDGKQKFELTLTEVISGAEAWSMIEAANMFNDPPEIGMEYVLAKFKVNVISLENEPLDIYDAKFGVVSKNGVMYNGFNFVVVPDPDLSTELYEGATHEGWTFFMVNENDSPKVVFDEGWDSESWFDLGL